VVLADDDVLLRGPSPPIRSCLTRFAPRVRLAAVSERGVDIYPSLPFFFHGRQQAPPDLLFTGTFDNPNFAAVNPDFNRDLMMKPADRIRIHLHDTPAGFRADLTDLTTTRPGR
jgi:hypothetical protein